MSQRSRWLGWYPRGNDDLDDVPEEPIILSGARLALPMGVAPESRHGCWQPWVSGLEIGRGDACRLGLAVMEPTYPCRWTVRRPGHLAISCKKFIVYGELGTASWPKVFSFPERSTRIGRIDIGVGKSRNRSFKRLEEPRARYLESSNGKHASPGAHPLVDGVPLGEMQLLM
jgi:hypothetical protein